MEEEEAAHVVDGFEGERRVAIENTNCPRALIVFTTAQGGQTGMDIRRQHEPSIEGSYWAQQQKWDEEESESRWDNTEIAIIVLAAVPGAVSPAPPAAGGGLVVGRGRDRNWVWTHR